MFTDPFGLCEDPKDPKCKNGWVVTLSVSASAALKALKIGGNVEAGAAINVSTGYMVAYAHGGPSVGKGASASAEAAVTWSGSLDDAVGHSGDPNTNAVEVEAGASLSANMVFDAPATTAGRPKLIGFGGSAGPGAGVLANTTVWAASSPAMRVKDAVKTFLPSAICRGLGTAC